MNDYKTAFWIMLTFLPIINAISEVYWYNKGLRKGIKIGEIQERIKNKSQQTENQ